VDPDITMVHSYGYRSGTRNKYSKKVKGLEHRRAGPTTTTRLLRTFRLGDRVDVIGDSGQQKGLPHKYYHGRTGYVYNVTPRAVGVVVNKYHRNGRIIPKRLAIRTSHVRPSRCQEDFRARIADNNAIIKKSKETGVKQPTIKRVPGAPKAGFTIKAYKLHFLGAKNVAFEDLWKV